MKIICNIYTQLKKKGMKQKELAKKLFVTEVTISRYVNGERIPNVVTAIQMARVLGCRVEDLYTIAKGGNKEWES